MIFRLNEAEEREWRLRIQKLYAAAANAVPIIERTSPDDPNLHDLVCEVERFELFIRRVAERAVPVPHALD